MSDADPHPRDRFALTAPLLDGARREVYRARDLRADRDVVIELRTAADDAGRAALLARARRVAALPDPRLAPVLELGVWGEHVFCVQPAPPGAFLDVRARRDEPLGAAAWRSLGLEVLGALAALHEAGLAHGTLDARLVAAPDAGPPLVHGAAFGPETGDEEAGRAADLLAFHRLTVLAADGGPARRDPESWRRAAERLAREARLAPPLAELTRDGLDPDAVASPRDPAALRERFAQATRRRLATVSPGGAPDRRAAVALMALVILAFAIALPFLLDPDEAPGPNPAPATARDVVPPRTPEQLPTEAERAAWRRDGAFLLERAAAAESPASRKRLADRAAPLLSGSDRERALAIAAAAEAELAAFTEREAAALLDAALAAADERREQGRLEGALAAFDDADAIVQRHPALAFRAREIAAARRPLEVAMARDAGHRGDFQQAAEAARQAARLSDFLGYPEERAAYARRAELFDRLAFCDLVLIEQPRFVTLELERLSPQTGDVDGAILLGARAAIVLERPERARALLARLLERSPPSVLVEDARAALALLD